MSVSLLSAYLVDDTNDRPVKWPCSNNNQTEIVHNFVFIFDVLPFYKDIKIKRVHIKNHL